MIYLYLSRRGDLRWFVEGNQPTGWRLMGSVPCFTGKTVSQSCIEANKALPLTANLKSLAA